MSSQQSNSTNNYINWSKIRTRSSKLSEVIREVSDTYSDPDLTVTGPTSQHILKLYQECSENVTLLKKLMRERGLHTEYLNSDPQLSDVGYMFREIQRQLNCISNSVQVGSGKGITCIEVTSSHYEKDSTLYLLDNYNKKYFKRLHSSLISDFSNLDYKSDSKQASRWIEGMEEDIQLLVIFIGQLLSTWFNSRYDIKLTSNSFLKLTSVPNWVDGIIFRISCICCSVSDTTKRWSAILQFAENLNRWLVSKGRYYEDSTTLNGKIKYDANNNIIPFSGERGGGVPQDLLEDCITSNGVVISPDKKIKFSDEEDPTVPVAILLEDIFKPSLYYYSIISCSKEELSKDKYLHSIRFASSSKLARNVELPYEELLKIYRPYLICSADMSTD